MSEVDFSFALCVIRVPFVYLKIGITPIKRVKCIVLKQSASQTVNDIASIVVVGKSSVSRIRVRYNASDS